MDEYYSYLVICWYFATPTGLLRLCCVDWFVDRNRIHYKQLPFEFCKVYSLTLFMVLKHWLSACLIDLLEFQFLWPSIAYLNCRIGVGLPLPIPPPPFFSPLKSSHLSLPVSLPKSRWRSGLWILWPNRLPFSTTFLAWNLQCPYRMA